MSAHWVMIINKGIWSHLPPLITLSSWTEALSPHAAEEGCEHLHLFLINIMYLSTCDTTDCDWRNISTQVNITAHTNKTFSRLKPAAGNGLLLLWRCCFIEFNCLYWSFTSWQSVTEALSTHETIFVINIFLRCHFRVYYATHESVYYLNILVSCLMCWKLLQRGFDPESRVKSELSETYSSSTLSLPVKAPLHCVIYGWQLTLIVREKWLKSLINPNLCC